MAYKIAVLAQKGGVGKSTIARLIATEFSRLDEGTWNVVIADMDVLQSTSFHWAERRDRNAITPHVLVERFKFVDHALAAADGYDVMVFDAAPHASQDTLKIARFSDVVIIPTGLSLDDLEPTVNLARELHAKGVKANTIVMGLCRVGDSIVEELEARRYLAETEFRTASGHLPDRTAYRRASDMGQAVTETPYGSLNQKAKHFYQSLMQQLYETYQSQEQQ
ncbi:ParA family protein [uncultured Cohaesibacter sp.]|uniref:ParA family protein n=1 Tax=uncultured Cohaesibacter sp. TaxID=1002546 RepID=UPI00292F76A6|nr:ParA family protein [uncultured Cohaesibacter sp.]